MAILTAWFDNGTGQRLTNVEPDEFMPVIDHIVRNRGPEERFELTGETGGTTIHCNAAVTRIEVEL